MREEGGGGGVTGMGTAAGGVPLPPGATQGVLPPGAYKKRCPPPPPVPRCVPGRPITCPRSLSSTARSITHTRWEPHIPEVSWPLSLAGGASLPPPCSSPLTLYAPPLPLPGGCLPPPPSPLVSLCLCSSPPRLLQDAVASIMGGHHPVILAFIQYLNMFLAAVG